MEDQRNNTAQPSAVEVQASDVTTPLVDNSTTQDSNSDLNSVASYGHGHGESLHGNLEDGSGIFYGDEGVDRDIDTTTAQSFSDGHHPLRNPVDGIHEADNPLIASNDLPDYSGGSGEQLQGQSQTSATQVRMQDERNRAASGGAQLGQQNTAGSASSPDRLEGPTSQPAIMTSAVEDMLTAGRSGGGAGDPLAARMLGTQREGELAASRNPEIRDPGMSDGYLYAKDDDNNPDVSENIAQAVGMAYNPANVAHDNRRSQLMLTLPTAQLAQLRAELRSVGVNEGEIEVREQEGTVSMVLVEADTLTRPYVEQAFNRYRSLDSTS